MIAAAAALALVPAVSTLPASAADAGATEVSRGVQIPAFYNPPSTLPDKDGALVRSEKLPLAASLPLPGGGSFPGTATRIMYKTTDNAGRPAAVTGAYLEPSSKWTGKGDRPLVVVAPGTQGQGDQCAASLGLQRPITINGRTVAVGYEDLSIYRLLSKGVGVVVTDYVGLGATDRLHTYVDRVDEGHAVLDAARAARDLHGSSVTDASKVGLFGYSQGGGATASAAELRDSYAPDVNLVGSYVGAPPANLEKVAKGIDGSALVGALGWTLNGLVQSHPDLTSIVDRHINAAGRKALADLSTACVGDGISRYAFGKSSSWTNDGSTLNQIVDEEPAVKSVLADQRIGKRTPHGPVRVATGVHDDIVAHAQARQLAADWCAKNADVTYKPIDVPNLGDKTLANHISPMVADQGNADAWLTDRLNGKPAQSNCASVPDKP